MIELQDIEEIVKIDVSNGDVLVIQLAEFTEQLSRQVYQSYVSSIHNQFDDIVGYRGVTVAVIPHGTKIQVIKMDDAGNIDNTTDNIV